MNCLCCSKPIADSASDEERKQEWHRSCVKRFFGTAKYPEIEISAEKLTELAKESVSRGLAVPGVQKKISLHLTTDSAPRLTLVNYPTGFILKPQTEEYDHLPESEYLAMRMAETAGIKTVPYALVRLSGQVDNLAYITRRIDRIGKGRGEKLAMEDFCQLDGKLTENKYRGSYERCAKIIQKYSIYPGIDLTDFFYRLLFSFVIGNSDMHLKNISLIESEPGSQKYILSPAYDLLPVANILHDKDQFALTLHGKTRNIRRKDFSEFAAAIGIPDKAAKSLMDRCVGLREKLFLRCSESFLPLEQQQKLIELIDKRLAVLRK